MKSSSLLGLRREVVKLFRMTQNRNKYTVACPAECSVPLGHNLGKRFSPRECPVFYVILVFHM